MKERLKYIDIAKGIAIICVVCGHVLIYDLYGFSQAWNKSPLVQFIYSFHMPLFIFLSGLVAPIIPITTIHKDIWKRFRNLMIPFFIIGSIYSLSFFHNLSFITNEMKYGYWYFPVLFYCYICNYISINKKIWLYLLKICILLILWKILPHLVSNLSELTQHILSINQFILYFPYFLAGSLIKRLNLQNILFNNNLIFYAAIAIWVLNSRLQFPYSRMIITMAAITVIMNICYKIESQKLCRYNLLEYIGSNTLYIYCFHYFILPLMTMKFLEGWLIAIKSSFLLDLLLTMIPMSFAIVSSLLIKKIFISKNIAKYIFNKQ